MKKFDLTRANIEIAFDPEYLEQADLTQDQIDALCQNIRSLIESGLVQSGGVYDLEGNAIDIDMDNLVKQFRPQRLH